MGDRFLERNEVPVVGEYDVLVVGGGVAGVSAALAARRNGCSTLIIEKSVMLGGLATLGLIAYYLPLCDGRGQQVIGGVAEELLYLSIKYGYDTLPQAWRSGEPPADGARYRTAFSPPAFVVALDELVEDEGIDVMLDTVFSRPVLEDGRCRGVIVENKSGRVGYRGRVVVDTTGDADVMARAGATCVEGSNWLSYWAYFTDLERMGKAVAAGSIREALWLRALGVLDPDNTNASEYSTAYRGTDAADVTRIVVDGRRLVRQALAEGGNGERALLTIPGMPQVRKTRRIRGRYELVEEDAFRRFDDSIGCVGDWRKAGPVYEIPYRTLVSREVSNVITAGRSIASADGAWEVTRVIPPASLTGQAAGTAAALLVEGGGDLQDVPMDELQARLQETGVVIHWD